MARKTAIWPSTRRPNFNNMPLEGCTGETVPLAVGRWYDFHEFGWHLGDVGSSEGPDGAQTTISTDMIPHL